MTEPTLAQLILAYDKALSTSFFTLSPTERAADMVQVAKAYKAMVDAAKAQV